MLLNNMYPLRLFDYFFETLIMPYEQRIRNIRQGLKTKKTEIVENYKEISKRIDQIINKSESLCICSSIAGDMQFSHFNFFVLLKRFWKNDKMKNIWM